MRRRVILTLTYDMGEYSDEDIPDNIEDWEETFYQSDVCPGDLEITGVILEDILC